MTKNTTALSRRGTTFSYLAPFLSDKQLYQNPEFQFSFEGCLINTRLKNRLETSHVQLRVSPRHGFHIMHLKASHTRAQHAPRDSTTDWRPLTTDLKASPMLYAWLRLGYMMASHTRVFLAQRAQRESTTGRRPPLVMKSPHAPEASRNRAFWAQHAWCSSERTMNKDGGLTTREDIWRPPRSS